MIGDGVQILCVSGSPRRKGNTDVLTERAARAAESAGVSVELVYLRDYAIQACVGCEQCREDRTCTRFFDGMHLLYPKLEQAKALVLGSPTHHYNVTAWVKAFIDRLYPYYEFSKERPGPWRSRLSGEGRVAVTFEVCEQSARSEASLTLAALRMPLEALGYEVCDEISVLGHFGKAAVRDDPTALERVSSAARELAGRTRAET